MLTKEGINSANRKDLQKYAKEYGFKANLSNDALRKALLDVLEFPSCVTDGDAAINPEASPTDSTTDVATHREIPQRDTVREASQEPSITNLRAEEPLETRIDEPTSARTDVLSASSSVFDDVSAGTDDNEGHMGGGPAIGSSTTVMNASISPDDMFPSEEDIHMVTDNSTSQEQPIPHTSTASLKNAPLPQEAPSISTNSSKPSRSSSTTPSAAAVRASPPNGGPLTPRSAYKAKLLREVNMKAKEKLAVAPRVTAYNSILAGEKASEKAAVVEQKTVSTTTLEQKTNKGDRKVPVRSGPVVAAARPVVVAKRKDAPAAPVGVKKAKVGSEKGGDKKDERRVEKEKEREREKDDGYKPFKARPLPKFMLKRKDDK